MSPDDFISQILDSINLVSFTVGDDFRFGAGRKGDTDLLKNWGEKKGILVENTETITLNGQRVSSTRIREELLNNNFNNAEKLLGRPYTFSGKIVHGQHLGRTINIPTANIWLPNQRLPIKGVYAVKCKLNDLSLNGIANMGVRPTVGGEKPVLEVHLFEIEKEEKTIDKSSDASVWSELQNDLEDADKNLLAFRNKRDEISNKQSQNKLAIDRLNDQEASLMHEEKRLKDSIDNLASAHMAWREQSKLLNTNRQYLINQQKDLETRFGEQRRERDCV